ncbi:MAG: hypothetical protein JXB13_00430 [Phycisphaerae bacterium]|nr:hypothetical protein [Phycisphaerae bacterium]
MTSSLSIQPSREPVTAPRPARWWLAVLVAAVVSLPFGYLLSYGAFLLAYFGLFFFLLFGLLVGAVMYRIALPARPIPRWQLLTGSLVVAAVCGGFSLAVECWQFPQDAAERTLKTLRILPEGTTRDDILQQARASVEKYLVENHWPGGALGYMRWKATARSLPVEVKTPTMTISRMIRYRGNRLWWIVRVILSLTFLPYAVHAVVKPLSKVDAPTQSEPPAADTP